MPIFGTNEKNYKILRFSSKSKRFADKQEKFSNLRKMAKSKKLSKIRN